MAGSCRPAGRGSPGRLSKADSTRRLGSPCTRMLSSWRRCRMPATCTSQSPGRLGTQQSHAEQCWARAVERGPGRLKVASPAAPSLPLPSPSSSLLLLVLLVCCCCRSCCRFRRRCGCCSCCCCSYCCCCLRRRPACRCLPPPSPLARAPAPARCWDWGACCRARGAGPTLLLDWALRQGPPVGAPPRTSAAHATSAGKWPPPCCIGESKEPPRQQ